MPIRRCIAPRTTARTPFRFFTADLARQASTRLTLEAGLRRAIESGELTVCYQPQVILGSQR
jgi:predicted signal transduction protein with EAL and GGDEF domain